MIKRKQRNYLIYLLMLLLFGILIYVAIKGGERFNHLTGLTATVAGNPWDMFRAVLANNLGGDITILLIQIVVVLLAVRLFSFLFRYIGQPGVIGEIVAGIVLGPSLLGYFFPDVFGWLFRPDSLTNLSLISQLGLILFMFVIGMELDFGVIRKKINETLVISHAGILVPFFLGIVASYWVYEEYASGQTDFLPFALFCGISMSITAFPVLARIIQERNMAKTQVGILSIASAANDDVTAWCLLAVVIAIAQAGTFVSALFAVGFTALYIIVMFYIVRPFLKKVGEVYATGEVINKTFVSFIFLVLLISATLTELIGIHALFGAFIAGVVMPSNLGFRKVMMEKVEDIALVFFLPLFFAYTGLHTEIGLIDTPELWIICLLFVVVAVVGKFGGCALAARLVGESWKDSLTIGTLMNTRGLMELVALNIGYEMGVLPPSIFVILVIMALVTTFMTTPLLNPIERIYRKQAVKESSKRRLLLSFGRPESGRELLYLYHLLFGKKLKDYHLVAAHYTVGTDLNPVKAEQYASESFQALKKEASHLNLRVEERYKVTDKLQRDLIHLAEEERAELLLIGSGYRFRGENVSQKDVSFPLLKSWMQLLKDNTLHLSGGLLKEKTDDIIGQVKCAVAVFANRLETSPKTISFLFGGEMDNFLLSYAELALEGGAAPVHIFCFQGTELPVERWSKQYNQNVRVTEFTDLSQLVFNKECVLVLSHAVCTLLLQDFPQNGVLPALLMIRPGHEQQS